MSRFARSPLKDDRSTKRPRTSTEAEMDQLPEHIADIASDGDTILVLDGMSAVPDKEIGLRVSSHSLGQASPIFKSLCITAKQAASPDSDGECDLVITLHDDDGDAMHILINILHLRNDKLPARLMPQALSKVAALARKYQCVVAVGRATAQWFDHLYASSTPFNSWEIVEAAYLLDEPMFFARFSSRWVLEQSLFGRKVPRNTSKETQTLAIFIAESHVQAQLTLRKNLDTLADAALWAFSKDKEHYRDYPPDMSPGPDEIEDGKPPSPCRVDGDGAGEYLGALRDAGIYPSTMWARPSAADATGITIGQLVEKVKAFREPAYDDVDKCEFCEDVKIVFTEQLESLRKEHEKRLWGMCLDCYKAGGINPSECRFDHPKVVGGLILKEKDGDGLGINGL